MMKYDGDKYRFVQLCVQHFCLVSIDFSVICYPIFLWFWLRFCVSFSLSLLQHCLLFHLHFSNFSLLFVHFTFLLLFFNLWKTVCCFDLPSSAFSAGQSQSIIISFSLFTCSLSYFFWKTVFYLDLSKFSDRPSHCFIISLSLFHVFF